MSPSPHPPDFDQQPTRFVEMPDEDMTQVRSRRRDTPAALALDQREHSLLVVQGQQVGRRVYFGTQPLVLGRRAGCDLMLSDPEISGRHCEVVGPSGESAARLTDLNSTNGSFVDGRRVTGAVPLPHGALLQMGSHCLRHEFVLRSEVEQAEAQDEELSQASRYVQSLLPLPMREGAVRVEWSCVPSTRLAGDAFDYGWLDAHQFFCCMFDVSGHGTGAAMHSVSILNLLRQRALADVDFAQPAQVLSRLNNMFQMDTHNGLFFSMWFGVYDLRDRRLRYASAGHHPAYLVTAERSLRQGLITRNLVMGAVSDLEFLHDSVTIPAGDTLYIFSDGAFEWVDRHGQRRQLDDFLPLLTAPPEAELTEPERLYRSVVAMAQPGPLDDDFSILSVRFD